MESRFNLVLLIVITVILASGATYFATSWPHDQKQYQKSVEAIAQKSETSPAQIGWKEYANEVLTFNYPPAYSVTEPGPGTLNAITVAKADTKRLEIFQLKNFPEGDRPWGFEGGETQEDIDGYVPKEFLKITVGSEVYDVWLYYSAADTETKTELHRIASSLKPNEGVVKRPHGQVTQQEILERLERFGMRTSLREPMYDHKIATSPDKKLTATVASSFNQIYIKITDTTTGAVRHYVPEDLHSTLLEEIGDLNFSPDGKKLAFGAYVYFSARNNEVLAGASPAVFIINLETGKQEVGISKKIDTVTRITGWKDGQPATAEEPLTDANRPGEYPTLFIPYNYR